MPNRESVHELINTLPDAALESAQRDLQNYQTWPPKPPIDVERVRKRVEELFRVLEDAAKRDVLVGTGFDVPAPSCSKVSARSEVAIAA
jgi:hypothetical protein